MPHVDRWGVEFCLDAERAIRQQVFAPRPPRPSDMTAGPNVTITRDAGGYTIAATGAAVDDASAVLASVAFSRRHQMVPDLRPGTAISVSRDAEGTTISAVVDDSSFVLAQRSLSPHPPRIEEIQQGAGIVITRNARGPIISAGAAAVDIATTEQTFGAANSFYGAWAIADASVLAGSNIGVWLANEAPVGRDADEAEMEPMHCYAENIAPGGFTLVAIPRDGPVRGAYRFNYLVG